MATFKLAVINNGTTQIVEYDYAKEECEKTVNSNYHGFMENVVEGMQTHFPNFALIVGKGNLTPFPSMDRPAIFTNDGIKDPITGETPVFSEDAFPSFPRMHMVWKGSVPLKLTGRPVLESIKNRMKRQSKSNQKKWNRFFMRRGGNTFLVIPTLAGYYAGNRNESNPTTPPHICMPRMLWDGILDIPHDHIYGGPAFEGMKWFRLCEYGSDRSNIPIHEALQQRTIPRMVIDLALADLKALGKWGRLIEWFGSQGTELHSFYNVIGKTRGRRADVNKAFLEFYKKEVS